jgi:hypothetical protein
MSSVTFSPSPSSVTSSEQAVNDAFARLGLSSRDYPVLFTLLALGLRTPLEWAGIHKAETKHLTERVPAALARVVEIIRLIQFQHLPYVQSASDISDSFYSAAVTPMLDQRGYISAAQVINADKAKFPVLARAVIIRERAEWFDREDRPSLRRFESMEPDMQHLTELNAVLTAHGAESALKTTHYRENQGLAVYHHKMVNRIRPLMMVRDTDLGACFRISCQRLDEQKLPAAQAVTGGAQIISLNFGMRPA